MPRSIPIYHIQLNITDLRSPAAAAFGVGGGVGRWAKTGCAKLAKATETASNRKREPPRLASLGTPPNSGGEFLRKSWCILMSDLVNHVAVIDIAARIAFANEGLGIRIEPECSRSHHPRLEQHTGIVYRDLIAQSVPFAPECLDHMHVVGVKISAFVQPSEVVEDDRIDD